MSVRLAPLLHVEFADVDGIPAVTTETSVCTETEWLSPFTLNLHHTPTPAHTHTPSHTYIPSCEIPSCYASDGMTREKI